MRLSEFDIPFRSNVECLEHAVRAAKHLNSTHAALLKAAFDEAEALDSLRLGRDAETGVFQIQRLHGKYVDILKLLGLSYEQVASAGVPKASRSEAEAAPAAPVMSMADFRAAASEA